MPAGLFGLRQVMSSKRIASTTNSRVANMRHLGRVAASISRRRFLDSAEKLGCRFLSSAPTSLGASMASASRARGLASATGAAASDGADSTGSADPVNLNRDALPRLPVPDLKASCQLFLGSIRPLVKDEGEMQGIADELERFSAEGGLGERLQKRLEDFESKQPVGTCREGVRKGGELTLRRGLKNSWLEDIWLRKAYLESRDPLPVNSNWWCQLKDHPAQPANLLELPPPRGVFTAFQIRRAAILTQNLLRFYSLMTQ